MYEFQGTLYSSRREMLDAIATSWLSAGGLNDRVFIEESLAEMTARDLADEVIEGWGLDYIDDDHALSHMGINHYDADMLARAFERVAADPDSAFGWCD